MRAALPAGVRRPLFGTAGPALPQGRLGAAHVPRQDHLRGLARTSVEAYFHSVSILRDPMREPCSARASSPSWAATRAGVFDRHAARPVPTTRWR
jgi:asparagine synthase (glutamine-hydrolysing)